MIAIKYSLFAFIATLFNLLFQHLSFLVDTGFNPLYVAIFFGTLAGLTTKYTLDKNFIFQNETKATKNSATRFARYSLTGIFTSIIFWGTEIVFDSLFQNPNAKYLGAVIGLSIGYFIKYFLDKKYVFIHESAVTT